MGPNVGKIRSNKGTHSQYIKMGMENLKKIL